MGSICDLWNRLVALRGDNAVPLDFSLWQDRSNGLVFTVLSRDGARLERSAERTCWCVFWRFESDPHGAVQVLKPRPLQFTRLCCAVLNGEGVSVLAACGRMGTCDESAPCISSVYEWHMRFVETAVRDAQVRTLSRCLLLCEWNSSKWTHFDFDPQGRSAVGVCSSANHLECVNAPRSGLYMAPFRCGNQDSCTLVGLCSALLDGE